MLSRPEACTFVAGDWDILSRCWFPVAALDAIGDTPISTRLLDVDLVIYRSQDSVVVAHDRCPHRGVMLSRGWLENGEIVCPYHGLRFGKSGHCTSIPADPDLPIPRRLSMHTFPVVERYGLVWTSINGEEALLPEFPAWEDSSYVQIMPPIIDIAGAIGRQIEGFIDVAHFAWAHEGTFGERMNSAVPSYKVEVTERGLHASYKSTVSNYAHGFKHLAAADFIWARNFDVFMPFAARLVIHFPEEGRLCILNAPSPMSARQTRLFSPIARNFDKEAPLEATYEFNRRVFEEDRAMIEIQRPIDLPLDMDAEAHIAADRSSIVYRRLLKQMGLCLQYSGR